jgi:opacity protein-like surface antigen
MVGAVIVTSVFSGGGPAEWSQRLLERTMRYLLCLLGVTFAANAFAEPYVGVRAGFWHSRIDGGDLELSSDIKFDGFAAGLYAGYRFVPWLGVEASISRLFEADDSFSADLSGMGDVADFNAKLSVPRTFGLYARPVVPVSEAWNLYGRFGVEFYKGKTKVTAEYQGMTESFTDSGTDEQFAWFLGVEWKKDRLGLGLETGRVEDSDSPIWITSAALSYYF